MKKLVALIFAFAVAMPVAMIAQDKPAAKEHTMTGCVAKSGDGIVVNNTAGKGPKVIGIVSSKVDLAAHVGHQIDVTGTAVPTAEAEAKKPAPPKADHYMDITAIKMVAAKCPA